MCGGLDIVSALSRDREIELTKRRKKRYVLQHFNRIQFSSLQFLERQSNRAALLEKYMVEKMGGTFISVEKHTALSAAN